MAVAFWCLSPTLPSSPPSPIPSTAPPFQLAVHGPGLFLSKHIPDQPDEGDQALQSRLNSHNRRRGGRGGGSGGGGSGGRRSGEDEAPVLGDLDWGVAEEPSILMWDGERVGGVELPQPSSETRPIRLVVSERAQGLFA